MATATLDQSTTFLTVEERQQEAARRTGRHVADIGKQTFRFSDLTQRGLLGDIDGGLGTLHYSLGLEDDMGLILEMVQLYRVRVKPLGLYLLPDEYRTPLRRPIDRASERLHELSVEVTLVRRMAGRGLYWIPFAALEEIDACVRDQAAEQQRAIDRIEQDWPIIAEHMLAVCQEIAARAQDNRVAYNTRLRAAGLTPPEITNAFVPALTAKLFSKVEAAKSRLRDTCSVRFVPRIIQLESEVMAEVRQVQEQRLVQATLQQQIAHVEAETAAQRRVTLAAEYRERETFRAEQTLLDLRVQAEASRLAKDTEAQDQVRQRKVEEALRNVEESVNPLVEVLYQTLSTLAGDLAEVQTSIQRNGYLRGNTAERARKIGPWLQTMLSWTRGEDIPSLARLDELVEQLGSLLEPCEGKRDSGPVELVLSDMLAICQEELRLVDVDLRGTGVRLG
jgi:hypothetical protein